MNEQPIPNEPFRRSAAPQPGVRLKALILDEAGREHCTITTTTIPAEVFEARAKQVRAAIENFYSDLGYLLISLTRELEQEPVVFLAPPTAAEPDHPRTHLRLVAAGGRRVLSGDARILMESAGLVEREVRQAVFDEV
jgi:hypothetical protein